MVNYADGKIYQIVNTKNDKMYVGSTFQALVERMYSHRSKSKTENTKFYKAMRDLGIENFSIHLYKTFPCQSKVELEAEEYKVMKEHQESGVELLNDFIGTRSTEQRRKLADLKRGKFQEENNRFNYGGILYEKAEHRYRFYWHENGSQKKESFNCNKYGVLGALQKAQDARKAKYPEWQTPEEEAMTELCAIEC